MQDTNDATTRYPAVRGLQRGLLVLQVLNRLGEASSARVAEHAGLPRSTVHRLLETLRSEGYVARAQLRDVYRLTSRVHSLSDGYRDDDWIVEIAGPVLSELFRKIVWPTDIATYHDGTMIVRATTHRVSPLSLSRVLPGTRFPMLGTALGRAYLAFCPDAEREYILEILASQASAETALARDRTAVDRLLDEVRSRGYGVRRRAEANRTASIAVPVCGGDNRVIGCLTVLWFDSAMPFETAVDDFLAPLSQAAREIEAQYRLLGSHR